MGTSTNIENDVQKNIQGAKIDLVSDLYGSKHPNPRMSESYAIDDKTTIGGQNLMSMPSIEDIKPRSSEGYTCGVKRDGEDDTAPGVYSNHGGTVVASSGQNAATGIQGRNIFEGRSQKSMGKPS